MAGNSRSLDDEIDLSGINRENAATTKLFTTSMFEMDLSLWNERTTNTTVVTNSTEIDGRGIWKLQGDLTFRTKSSNSSIWGGVCLGFPEQEKRFDCLIYKVIMDIEDLDGSDIDDVIVENDEDEGRIECQKVTIYDGYQTKGPSIDSTALRIDDSVDTVDDTALNWMLARERIEKKCKLSKYGVDRIDCERINIGFTRNF